MYGKLESTFYVWQIRIQIARIQIELGYATFYAWHTEIGGAGYRNAGVEGVHAREQASLRERERENSFNYMFHKRTHTHTHTHRKETASITCSTRRRLARTGCLSITTGVCAYVLVCVCVCARACVFCQCARAHVNVQASVQRKCVCGCGARAQARLNACACVCSRACARAGGWRLGDRRSHTLKASSRGSRVCLRQTQIKPRACCRMVFTRMAVEVLCLLAVSVCPPPCRVRRHAEFSTWRPR